jgi:hypothetical protein
MQTAVIKLLQEVEMSQLTKSSTERNLEGGNVADP